MNSQWQNYLNVLPGWMKQSVDELGRENLQQLRLRLGQPPQLCLGKGSLELKQRVTQEDLKFIVNTASQYSPWACASIAKGYITLPGGHRIGLAGDTVVKQGTLTGMRWISSMCIRRSMDFPGISDNILSRGSILIIGAPGWGKTTLLRDLIRNRSNNGPGSVCVIDERNEVFPVSQDSFCYFPGKRTDVISGCCKSKGLDMAIRCMSASAIAVDEITADEDCAALIQAAWCGVDVMATAHAGSKKELLARPVYKPLVDMGIFQTLVVMKPDKSYFTERMA